MTQRQLSEFLQDIWATVQEGIPPLNAAIAEIAIDVSGN